VSIEKGFYWARGLESTWYDYIAEVYDYMPFLKVKIWDRRNDSVIDDLNPKSLIFGPRIEEPEVKQR